ncbi:uncharacterized protein [Apostichopus japonicus]|uniref:uncharacterized protein isoform X2 n=1 Tax=Stichopus japonicus TaxID=307972 RepID=UPI003AB85932
MRRNRISPGLGGPKLRSSSIPPELQIKYEDRTIVDHIEIPKEGNFTATCEVVNDVHKSVSIRMTAGIGSDKREEHGHGAIALTVPVYTSVYLTCGNFLEGHLQYNYVTVRVVVKTRVQVVIDDTIFTVDHDHDVISDKQIPVYCTGQGDISALYLQAVTFKKGNSTNLPAKSHIKNIRSGFERSKWMLPQDVEKAVVICLANSSVEKYNNTQITVTVYRYVLPTVQITLDGNNLSTTLYLAPHLIYRFRCVAYQCRPSVNLTWEVNNSTFHQGISKSSMSRNIHRDDTFDVSISIDLHLDSKVKTVTCSSEGVKPFQRRRHSVTIVVTQRQLGSFLTYLLLCMGGVILLCCFVSLFRRWRLHCSNQKHSLHYVSRYQNEVPIELQDTQIDGNDSVPLHDPMPTGAKANQFDRSRVTSLTLLSSHEGLMQYWLGNLEAENKTQIVARCVSDKARLKDAYEFMDLINQLDLSLCHENLVKLLGVSVSEIPCYTYHEYVPGGTLRDFLMNNFTLPDESMLFEEQADGMTRKISELCWIAQNIASALDYLCKREYTHPAVSTRKILVDLRGTCKLYDILPLEKARTRVEYLISKEHPPLAWLAPESLFLGQYSALSDVWSFGIFLWELFAFGETPYAGNDAKQIEYNIRQSKLLNCPIVCPGGIYSLMISSWETDVSKRPSMSVLFMKLDEICNGYQQEVPVSSGTEDSSHYHCLALDQEDDYVRCGNTT